MAKSNKQEPRRIGTIDALIPEKPAHPEGIPIEWIVYSRTLGEKEHVPIRSTNVPATVMNDIISQVLEAAFPKQPDSDPDNTEDYAPQDSSIHLFWQLREPIRVSASPDWAFAVFRRATIAGDARAQYDCVILILPQDLLQSPLLEGDPFTTLNPPLQWTNEVWTNARNASKDKLGVGEPLIWPHAQLPTDSDAESQSGPLGEPLEVPTVPRVFEEWFANGGEAKGNIWSLPAEEREKHMRVLLRQRYEKGEPLLSFADFWQRARNRQLAGLQGLFHLFVLPPALLPIPKDAQSVGDSVEAWASMAADHPAASDETKMQFALLQKRNEEMRATVRKMHDAPLDFRTWKQERQKAIDVLRDNAALIERNVKSLSGRTDDNAPIDMTDAVISVGSKLPKTLRRLERRLRSELHPETGKSGDDEAPASISKGSKDEEEDDEISAPWWLRKFRGLPRGVRLAIMGASALAAMVALSWGIKKAIARQHSGGKAPQKAPNSHDGHTATQQGHTQSGQPVSQAAARPSSSPAESPSPPAPVHHNGATQRSGNSSNTGTPAAGTRRHNERNGEHNGGHAGTSATTSGIQTHHSTGAPAPTPAPQANTSAGRDGVSAHSAETSTRSGDTGNEAGSANASASFYGLPQESSTQNNHVTLTNEIPKKTSP